MPDQETNIRIYPPKTKKKHDCNNIFELICSNVDLLPSGTRLDFNKIKMITNLLTVGFFNWTMTYRHDSDIPWPEGWIDDLSDHSFYVRKIDQWKPYDSSWKPSKALRQMAKEKTGKVSWLVSNCRFTPSHRENYVGYVGINFYYTYFSISQY